MREQTFTFSTCIQWYYLCNNVLINYHHAICLRERKNVWFCPRKKPSFKEINVWWLFPLNPGWMWQTLLLVTVTWSHSPSGVHSGDCTLLTACRPVCQWWGSFLKKFYTKRPIRSAFCCEANAEIFAEMGTLSAWVPQWLWRRDPATPTPASTCCHPRPTLHM